MNKMLNQNDSKIETFWWIFEKGDDGRIYCLNTPKIKVKHNIKFSNNEINNFYIYFKSFDI